MRGLQGLKSRMVLAGMAAVLETAFMYKVLDFWAKRQRFKELKTALRLAPKCYEEVHMAIYIGSQKPKFYLGDQKVKAIWLETMSRGT